MHAKNFTRRLKTPVTASVWYCASSAVAKAVAFLLTPIYTRYLTESEYGAFVIYQSLCALLGAVLTLEIGSSALYSGFSKFKGREDDYTKSSLAALLLLLPVAAVVLLLFGGRLSLSRVLGFGACIFLCINIFTDAAVSLLLTKERFRYGYKRVFFINTALSVAAGGVGVLLIGKFRAYARIAGACAASGALCIYAAIKIAKVGKVRAEMIRYAVKSGAVLLPSFISALALTNTDKLVIARTLGASEAASYSIAHSVGLLLTFFTVGAYGALKPWMIRKLRKESDGAALLVLCEPLTLTAIAAGALACIMPELFSFLAPMEYYDALPCAYLLVCALIPMLVVNMATTELIQSGKSALSSLVGATAAILNAALCFALVPRLGVIYAAFAFLLSYVLYAALVLALTEKMRFLGKIGAEVLLKQAVLTLFLYLLRPYFSVRFSVLLILLFYAARRLVRTKSVLTEIR